jgi:hypothetical protein
VATLISKATGNFTAAGTWAPVSGVATAEQDIDPGSEFNLTTAYQYTSTFVPAATGIDGVGTKISRRVASPTGTMSVKLENVTNPGSNEATVVINVADIYPIGAGAVAPSSWYFFKFASTVTPNGTDTYKIGFKVSVNSEITMPSSGAIISHFVRLTSAASAPAAGDKLIVIGEMTGQGTSNSFTVTMDNTATTSFGPTVSGGPPQGMVVGDKATLSFGTAASTNYYLKIKGVLLVSGGGTLNIGTSGTPMPSTSTAVLEFDSVANVDSGLFIQNFGVFNCYGASKTTLATLMTADKVATNTVIALASTSGWAASDEIAFAPTSTTATQAEKKTILTVDSGTQVTLTAGLTNAHLGTSPTQAEVVNLTRNVKIRGVSTTLQGYCFFSALATVDGQYVEFYQLGSATTNKRGIDVLTTTGTCNLQYCSHHDYIVTSSLGINLSGVTGSGVTWSNNVTYAINNAHFNVAATTGSWTCSGNTCIGSTGGTAIFNLADVGGVLTSCTAAGGSARGIIFNETSALGGTISDLTSHSNATVGIELANILGATFAGTNTCWRNGSATNLNIAGGTVRRITFATVVCFGSTQNVRFALCTDITIQNLTCSGDTTFASSYGIQMNDLAQGIVIENGDFGTVSGIKTAHTSGDIYVSTAFSYIQAILRNCKLASTNELVSGTQANMLPGSYIRSQKHDQTAGLHRSWFPYGQIDSDTSEFRTASPSEKLTPNNASNKLESGIKRAEVLSGATATPTVHVKKSGTYNGNAPRLILKKNVAAGITADTVLATLTGSADGDGYWTLSGPTTPAVTDDAVLEFVVDCDGTAGVVNVDDYTIA